MKTMIRKREAFLRPLRHFCPGILEFVQNSSTLLFCCEKIGPMIVLTTGFYETLYLEGGMFLATAWDVGLAYR